MELKDLSFSDLCSLKQYMDECISDVQCPIEDAYFYKSCKIRLDVAISIKLDSITDLPKYNKKELTEIVKRTVGKPRLFEQA